MATLNGEIKEGFPEEVLLKVTVGASWDLTLVSWLSRP